MNISFGRKIPIAKCHILDKEQKSFVPATVYEYDCTTKGDIQEIRKLDDSWRFTPTIANNMSIKNHSYYTQQPNHNRFFNIQKDTGEILGLAFCEEQGKSIDVHFLETKQDDKNKFVGQALLASLCIFTLNNGQTQLRVKSALKTAEDFYKKTCGFKQELKSSYLISDRHMPKFIKQTEKRTHYPIVDVQSEN